MSSLLPILSIETSGELCGAAVQISEDNYSEIIIKQKNVHSEKIFTVIDNAIRLSGLKLNQIKAIAISAGPGSFTGLRIGMSAAKGIGTGSNLPIIPVPTFEALALQICSFIPDKTEFIIANKVNSDEIYYSRFLNNDGMSKVVDKIEIISCSKFNNINHKGILVFGNAVAVNLRTYTSPSPGWAAKWAYLFGKDLLTFNYDFLEPQYHKQFSIR
jgi:tRNA threonylcarbamoyladenosine biosynthesis protein TsaB